MADLLPSTPDTSAVEEADPRVIGVDSDDADELIAALSSETARELLAALHDEPANPAKLAERADTTIQNAQYHLEKLEAADLIEVVDTVYSEKGREMRVYAPSDRPLVVVAGSDDDTTGLKAALSRLLGALSALALSSVLVQALFGDWRPFALGGADGGSDPDPAFSADGSGGGGDGAAPPGTEDATPSPTPEPDGAGTQTPPSAGGTEAPGTVGDASVEGTPTPTPDVEPTGTPADTPASLPTDTPTALPTDADTATEVAPYVAEQAAALSPGLVFFAGGATVLLVGFALWYYRQRRPAG